MVRQARRADTAARHAAGATRPSELVVEGCHYRTGDPIRVRIEGDHIAEVVAVEHLSAARRLMIAPGLVDLQLNGYLGLDFSTVPFRDGLLRDVTEGLWRLGVTTYFPTIITNPDEVIRSAMASIARQALTDRLLRSSIGGIHLEGPFISPEDGARGAHPIELVRPPDLERVREWSEASQGTLRIITMSPEWPGAASFIAQCTALGIVVSIGHTAATPSQVHEAVIAGARLSTHLGNGTHLLLPRHPNYLWEQLASDELSACVIADGIHLPDTVLKVIIRVKGPNTILVSDMAYLAGLKPGHYRSRLSGELVLTPDGRLHLASEPKLLAGAAKPLVGGVHHLVTAGLAEFGQAWDMASIHPARALGLEVSAGIAPGAPADLVVLSHDTEGTRIHRTYKAGTLVHDATGVDGGCSATTG